MFYFHSPAGASNHVPWRPARLPFPGAQHAETCTKVPVSCPRCGIIIGQRKRYDAPYYLSRYSDAEPNEYYGGEYYGYGYCSECYDELVMTEDCLP